ncbi:MAG: hypothetical protein ACLTSG_14595 [Lachnospiraceae bacterium]
MESAMQDFKGDTGEVLDVHPDTILIPSNYKLKRRCSRPLEQTRT